MTENLDYLGVLKGLTLRWSTWTRPKPEWGRLRPSPLRIRLRWRCSVRRKRTGIADDRFGARLYSEIAQPLRVPFACSRKTDDGSRDRLARWVDHAPVMKCLDGEFECDAQETRGLWIEPLSIKISSDRRVGNSSSAPVAQYDWEENICRSRSRPKNPDFSFIFFA
jgi:hypothetical protein